MGYLKNFTNNFACKVRDVTPESDGTGENKMYT